MMLMQVLNFNLQCHLKHDVYAGIELRSRRGTFIFLYKGEHLCGIVLDTTVKAQGTMAIDVGVVG